MSATYSWCKDKTRLVTLDKPVFCIDECGDKYWHLNGKPHRENGPACEYRNGTVAWYLNGQRHRENGPACEYTSGTKAWFLNDKRHRINGPAIEYTDGNKSWYLKGKKYSESDYWKELQK